ncbi:hypothetical protein Tco_0100402, partial [Tanacetum coccineum]
FGPDQDGIEHGKAGLDLASLEGYDPEADEKFTAALQALKDLKYPLVDELEQLKDASIDCIMASLHLESDTGEDAPPEVRSLGPCTSQLKILVYPEVRDPRNPWAVRKEILLEDAIAANISRAVRKEILLKAGGASEVQQKSLFLVQFFNVLNSGKVFFADLERNLFRPASLPLMLWTSLIVRGDGSCSTVSTLSGHGLIPSGPTTYPRNIPLTASNVYFLGLNFILIFLNI